MFAGKDVGEKEMEMSKENVTVLPNAITVSREMVRSVNSVRGLQNIESLDPEKGKARWGSETGSEEGFCVERET